MLVRVHVLWNASVQSEVKRKPGGNPEPGDRLRFRFVRGVRASGRAQAASACEAQRVPPHAGPSAGKLC